jgi:hypothetical protein
MKIVCSSTRSRGGDPYCTVRILCESGVRIKILEFGSWNPDPYHRITFSPICGSGYIFAFRVLMNFKGSRSEDPNPGSRLIQASLENFKPWFLIRTTFCMNLDFLGFLKFFQKVRYAVKKMRCVSRPECPDRHIRLRSGTVKMCETSTASNYGTGI